MVLTIIQYSLLLISTVFKLGWENEYDSSHHLKKKLIYYNFQSLTAWLYIISTLIQAVYHRNLIFILRHLACTCIAFLLRNNDMCLLNSSCFSTLFLNLYVYSIIMVPCRWALTRWVIMFRSFLTWKQRYVVLSHVKGNFKYGSFCCCVLCHTWEWYLLCKHWI